jgi:hypothetical protein
MPDTSHSSCIRTIGRGRCCLEVWEDLCIATVIKRTEKKHVVEVERRLTRGTEAKAQELLTLDKGCQEFNTSFIERLNGTFCERLASLSRKYCHAATRIETLERGMYLVGCTYNFCFPHHELSKSKHVGFPCTPAMAAGLTDHVWTVSELLRYKVAPSPWVEPKRRGRPRKQLVCDQVVPKRPRGRPHKVA